MFRIFNHGRMRFDQNSLHFFTFKHAHQVIQRSLLVFVLLWGGDA